MPDSVVLVERAAEGYAVLTLNRPAAMNALSRQLRAELARIITELEADPTIRVLILTGAGRAFTAGLDLKELGASDPGEAVFGQSIPDPVTALGQFSGPLCRLLDFYHGRPPRMSESQDDVDIKFAITYSTISQTANCASS